MADRQWGDWTLTKEDIQVGIDGNRVSISA